MNTLIIIYPFLIWANWGTGKLQKLSGMLGAIIWDVQNLMHKGGLDMSY